MKIVPWPVLAATSFLVGFLICSCESGKNQTHRSVIEVSNTMMYEQEFELPVSAAVSQIVKKTEHHRISDLQLTDYTFKKAIYRYMATEGFTGLDSVTVRICHDAYECNSFDDHTIVFNVIGTPYGTPYTEYYKPSLYSSITYKVAEGKKSVFLEDMSSNKTYYLWLTGTNENPILPDSTDLPPGFVIQAARHTVDATFTLPFDQAVPLINDNRGNVYIRIH